MTVPEGDDVAEYWLKLAPHYFLTTFIDGYERNSDNDPRSYNILYVPDESDLDHIEPTGERQTAEAESIFKEMPREFAIKILFNCSIEKNYNRSTWTAFILL